MINKKVIIIINQEEETCSLKDNVSDVELFIIIYPIECKIQPRLSHVLNSFSDR